MNILKLPSSPRRKYKKETTLPLYFVRQKGRDAIMICGLIMPRHDSSYTPNEKVYECLRAKYHTGQHLAHLENGTYILWEFDVTCTDCHPEECECFISQEISPEKAGTLLPYKPQL